YGTKACAITDGASRLVSFALAPGQAHEPSLTQDLVEFLPDVPSWIVGDKGYASHTFRRFIWDQGARPALPSKSNEAPVGTFEGLGLPSPPITRRWGRAITLARSFMARSLLWPSLTG
ncbi:transposase, partial [Skermanella aerolata]